MAVRTFEAPVDSGLLLLDADEQWSAEAEGLLAHLATLPAAQLADLTIDIGWATLAVSPVGESLRVRGPSYDHPGAWSEDLSPHLAAAATQARTAALLAAPLTPIRFDSEITVELDALDATAIYLKRTDNSGDEAAASDSDADVATSSWHLGLLTAEAPDHIHLDRRPAWEIAQRLPCVLEFLALPEGSLIGFVDGGVDAVFDPRGRRVMGRGGIPSLAAHPERLTAAAEELQITEPEALACSLYHPEHGYYLVWREEPPSMIAVHPNGEQLRISTLIGPDEFAELWTLGDRTPPGYSL